VRLYRIISVFFVLLGLLSSGYFLNDGWRDEPIAPEKDSLVVEETETTQDFREEVRAHIVVLSEVKESKSCLHRRQQSFSTALVSKFNCYQSRIGSDDSPDDLRIAFASFLI
jgi:hypothetical protein